MIYKVDFLGRNATVIHDVALRTFAYGDDAVGLFHGLAELPRIYQSVGTVVEFRVAHEDKVVYRYDCLDAPTLYPQRKLTRKTVEHVHLVAQQVGHDAFHAPQPLYLPALGIYKPDVPGLTYLRAQLLPALVGGIEPQLGIFTDNLREVVHQRASVASQSRSVAHYALCVESYSHAC